jgi:DNA-binding MarR family transcriptional regulator
MIRQRMPSQEIADLGNLEDHVGYMLRRAQLAVFADFTAAQTGAVVRPGQFSVLAVIGGNAGLSQSQLCEALGIKRANLVAVIDHLESLKLVSRQPSPTDRRSNRLHLTPAGERALKKSIADLARHEARISRLLGPTGRTELLKLLAKLCKLGGDS